MQKPRSLLFTALTRARRLVVIVGQRRALHLAVRDWRRTARQTALGGLLTGALRFSWPRGAPDQSAPEMDDSDAWEGLTAGDPGA